MQFHDDAACISLNLGEVTSGVPEGCVVSACPVKVLADFVIEVGGEVNRKGPPGDYLVSFAGGACPPPFSFL